MTPKNLFVPLLISLMIMVLNPGCSETKDEPLNRLNWSERNHEILNRMINDYGHGGKSREEGKTPYIVMDWDQTCAHFDVEEALMRYQIFNLRFRFSEDQFRGLLKDTINGVSQLSDRFGNIRLAGINSDLMADFRYIRANYKDFGGKMTFGEIAATPQYADFAARLIFLCEGYYDTPGIGMDYTFQWELFLLTGYTVDEVKSLAKEAISYELANKIDRVTLTTPAGLKTASGVVSCTYNSGLRVFPEMQDLIATCMKQGIDVFIVSASYKPVVEVFGGVGNFGYNLSPGQVIGMELETDSEGRIKPEYKKGWVKTVRGGKVEAINRVIKTMPGKDHDPIFAAGDSDGDIEMLTGFPGMKLALIWNRAKGGEIGDLCKKAAAEAENPNPRFILQGRNENTGMAIPSSGSILLGDNL